MIIDTLSGCRYKNSIGGSQIPVLGSSQNDNVAGNLVNQVFDRQHLFIVCQLCQAQQETFTSMNFRHEIVLAVLLLVLFAMAGWLMPSFVELRSQLILSRHLWETAILAISVTLIIITGGIDLSVGAVFAASAVVGGIVLEATGSLPLALVATVAFGSLLGLGNGLMITKLWVPPFIATLGMSQVLAAANILISGNRTINGVLSGRDPAGLTGCNQ